ncbi:MAG: nucleoid-associated protein, partial [Clostridiales bacterium]|nr:nucleoid-associated protein [Clostridiales bacterium]
IETPFSESLRSFFKDKLSTSVGSSNSFDIEYSDVDGLVPTQLEAYFNDDTREITASQEIAKQLHKMQTAKNPGGLMLFVFCRLEHEKVIAILKVEREEGVQISKENTSDGHIRFNMEHIENLMLTKKTKLFKIALFYKDGNKTKGILSDQQMGMNIGKEVAMYFLGDFLQCKLIDDPSVVTKRFFDATQEFINNSEMPPEKKAMLLTHMLSALSNNTNAINVQTFAENSLDYQIADDFLEFMNRKSVPCTSFVKDIALISNKLSKQQFIFDSGILVVTPINISDQQLTYQEAEGGKLKMLITDSLKKVKTK